MRDSLAIVGQKMYSERMDPNRAATISLAVFAISNRGRTIRGETVIQVSIRSHS